MKMYILIKHPVAWHRWKSANVAFDLKEPHREKSKKRFTIGYGAIIEHFGSVNPYKKEDAQQQKFMEDLLFVAKVYLHISIVES
jgi:hypothetical protein